MTEYWVSQGNHWCDFCKIYISKNPATIRNHELGTRHKENVAKRLADMRKDKAAKEKQEQEAARSFLRIEAQATRSYHKDLAASSSNGAGVGPPPDDHLAWDYDTSSAYYYDQQTGISYDPKSAFYYSDVLGKWVTRDEAFTAARTCSASKPKHPLQQKPAAQNKPTPSAPAHAVSGSLNLKTSVKGAPSSVAVGKRKRPAEKPNPVSAEESAALKAREAARKRVQDREKTMLGLYGN